MPKIQSVRFLKSATSPTHYPQHLLPEIAFIGRSNVGKSSLLNVLANKKNLARISNTPGRTQLINFFVINEMVCFVDLPGYGFAKVPDAVRRRWQPMIEAYLRQREQLKSVVLLLDARHIPSQHDIHMRQWLHAQQVPTIFVATKIDKLPGTKRAKQCEVIRKTLELQEHEVIIQFSSLTSEGVQTVWQTIIRAITASTTAGTSA
ncbi:small GTP-binding protein domain protein [Candidatus Moduliflexus flocculans]|uniref:Probable GTP-binding protein EngB n=1 Tax=Candidatus Moduliflexus flocculans TaxID=1499966 RepID=A0A0S6VXK0_9BACT|nr:small GTP-binding protein domain protein [Candidatus Moduliflexus flocculans]